MWWRATRRNLFSRGLAALLALVVSGGALNWGHAGGDDPDCNTVLVQHDHNAHRLNAAPLQSSTPADHCYICHSLRLLHTSIVARGPRAMVPADSTSFRQIDELAASAVDGSALSSRGPPAISL